MATAGDVGIAVTAIMDTRMGIFGPDGTIAMMVLLKIPRPEIVNIIRLAVAVDMFGWRVIPQGVWA